MRGLNSVPIEFTLRGEDVQYIDVQF